MLPLRISLGTALLFAGVAFAPKTDAAIIYQDTFAGGANANNTAYPRASSGANGMTMSAVNDGTLGEALQVVRGTLGNPTPLTTFGFSFPATTLNIGDSITFSFDFRWTAGVPNITRTGLYNSGGSGFGTDGTPGSWFNSSSANGYYAFIRNNDATGNSTREDNATPKESGGLTLGTNNTTAYNYGSGKNTWLYSISRVSATQVDITTTIQNASGTPQVSFTNSDTSGITSVFDVGLIRLDNVSSTVAIDNVTVSVVPEPSTAMLVGTVGLLALLRRRRVSWIEGKGRP